MRPVFQMHMSDYNRAWLLLYTPVMLQDKFHSLLAWYFGKSFPTLVLLRALSLVFALDLFFPGMSLTPD